MPPSNLTLRQALASASAARDPIDFQPWPFDFGRHEDEEEHIRVVASVAFATEYSPLIAMFSAVLGIFLCLGFVKVCNRISGTDPPNDFTGRYQCSWCQCCCPRAPGEPGADEETGLVNYGATETLTVFPQQDDSSR